MKVIFRDYIISFFVGLLPEFGIAYLLMKLFDESWKTFWIIFFSIQALYLTVWLFRTVFNKIMFEIQYKTKIIEYFYTDLVQNQFPDPFSIYHNDVENYFREVINDQSSKTETRMRATAMLAELQCLEMVGEIQIFFRIKRCAKIAVKKYMYLNFDHEEELRNIDSNDSNSDLWFAFLNLNIDFAWFAICVIFVCTGGIIWKASKEFGWNFWESLIAFVFLIGLISSLLDVFKKVKKIWAKEKEPEIRKNCESKIVVQKLGSGDLKKRINKKSDEHENVQHDYEQILSYGKKIIIDHSTGLIWQQSGSKEELTFEAAQHYIKKLNSNKHGGFNDWRLPNLEEAKALITFDTRNDDLWIDTVFDKTQRWIWTVDQEDNNHAWVANFATGITWSEKLVLREWVDYSSEPWKTMQGHRHVTRFVRAVRRLKISRQESMMKIDFKCPKCQFKYSALPEQAGKVGTCKNCGTKITVPKSHSIDLNQEFEQSPKITK